MKKHLWIFLFIMIFTLASCDKNEEIDTDSMSSSDKLNLYSSLLSDIESKGKEASAADYYKTNFSYSVSYISGRTEYNVAAFSRTCKVRNDSLYILKETSYQYSTNEPQTETEVYLKENEDIYLYSYQGETITLDTNEILPVYDKQKQEDFDLIEVFGFSEYNLTSQSFDGFNGDIEKENNTYTIKMPYSEVKENSLVKFIYKLGYFSNMFNYVSEDEFKLDFIYKINDNGYDFEYGFSYSTETNVINAKVNLSLESIESFNLIDFNDNSKYLLKYPETLDATMPTLTIDDEAGGRYNGRSLFKFQLEPGYYGIIANNTIVSNYAIYNSDAVKINKESIEFGTNYVNTNYFKVEESGIYYIYLEINEDTQKFKLEKLGYETYGAEAKNLEDLNEGTLEGVFDYEKYIFTIDTQSTITITNNSDNDLCLIIPVTSFFTKYVSIGIKSKESQSFNLRKGTYYLIVSPYYGKDSLNYSFSVSVTTTF